MTPEPEAYKAVNAYQVLEAATVSVASGDHVFAEGRVTPTSYDESRALDVMVSVGKAERLPLDVPAPTAPPPPPTAPAVVEPTTTEA